MDLTVLKRVYFKPDRSKVTLESFERGVEVSTTLTKCSSGSIKVVVGTSDNGVAQIGRQLYDLLVRENFDPKYFLFEVGSSTIDNNGQVWIPGTITCIEYSVAEYPPERV